MLTCVFVIFNRSMNADENGFSYSGYAEIYYRGIIPKIANKEIESFVYNHKVQGSIRSNLLLLQGSYNDENYKGNIGLMAGDYATYNLRSEPSWAQYIYEATMGIALDKKQNIWLQVGIMPSHIGFENAKGKDCWTLTRSIQADNSPYYESGLALHYSNNDNSLDVRFLVVNGWQQIAVKNHGIVPAIGLQIQYRPNSNILLNYSNYIGNCKINNVGSFRTYHNVYAISNVHKNVDLITGLDLGTEKIAGESTRIWYSPIILLRYKAADKIHVAARTEFMVDKSQVIIQSNDNNSIITGYSLNVDYTLLENVLLRCEGKYLLSDTLLFNNASSQTSITFSGSYHL